MNFQVIVRGIGDSVNKNVKVTITVAKTEEDFNETTVRDLKEKIRHEVPGAPDVEQQRIVFASSQLEDDKKFSDYNIRHLALITVIMRMPGGAQMLEYFFGSKVPTPKTALPPWGLYIAVTPACISYQPLS